MKILFRKDIEALKNMKRKLEVAEIVTNGKDQTFDKDLAIKQLHAAIRDIYVIIGI
jgi:tRNA-binding EMAP/Myf-like protein